MNNAGQSFDIRGFMVDNAFLKMFSYEMIQGDPNGALIEPFSIVISESLAKAMVADVILSIGRDHALQERGEACYYLAKNRFGNDKHCDDCEFLADLA